MKKQLFVALSVITIMTTAHPMQRLASKLGQWCTKSIDSSFMTGVHWSIAAAMPISEGIIRLLIQADPKKELKSIERKYGILTNPSELTQNFIEKEFAKRNTPIKKVLVYSNPQKNMFVTTHHCLITQAIHNDLHDAIQEGNENTKKEIAAVLNHEANHKKNKDALTGSLACLLMPLITHIAIKTINKLFVPQSVKINSFVAQEFIKIPSGVGKFILSMGGIAAFSRYQEQRADNEVDNNIDTLTRLKRFLQTNGDEKNVMVKNKSTLSQAWQSYTASHPSLESRIAKLDQRILLLEKSQQKQKSE